MPCRTAHHETPHFRLIPLGAELARNEPARREGDILELTQSAVSVLRRVMAAEGAAGIRIAACGDCSGLRYEMELATAARAGDAVISFGDVRVFVDAASTALLAGVEVDFCDTPKATGFVFNNPGCGLCSKRKNCGG
jgi:iron-sulfur cluster assembly protein